MRQGYPGQSSFNTYRPHSNTAVNFQFKHQPPISSQARFAEYREQKKPSQSPSKNPQTASIKSLVTPGPIQFANKSQFSGSQISSQKSQQLKTNPAPYRTVYNTSYNKRQDLGGNQAINHNLVGFSDNRKPYQFVTLENKKNDHKYYESSPGAFPSFKATPNFKQQTTTGFISSSRTEERETHGSSYSNYQSGFTHKLKGQRSASQISVSRTLRDQQLCPNQIFLVQNQVNGKSPTFESTNDQLADVKRQLQISRKSFTSLESKLTKIENSNRDLNIKLQEKQDELRKSKLKEHTYHQRPSENIDQSLKIQRLQSENKGLKLELITTEEKKNFFETQLTKLRFSNQEKQSFSREHKLGQQIKKNEEAQLFKSKIGKLSEQKEALRVENARKAQQVRIFNQRLEQQINKNKNCEDELKSRLQQLERAEKKQKLATIRMKSLQTKIVELEQQTQTLKRQKPKMDELQSRTAVMQAEKNNEIARLLAEQNSIQQKLKSDLAKKQNEVRTLTHQKNDLNIKMHEKQIKQDENKKLSQELAAVERKFEQFKAGSKNALTSQIIKYQVQLEKLTKYKELYLQSEKKRKEESNESKNKANMSTFVYYESFVQGRLIIEQGTCQGKQQPKIEQLISIQIGQEILNSKERIYQINRAQIEPKQVVSHLVNQCKSLGLKLQKLKPRSRSHSQQSLEQKQTDTDLKKTVQQLSREIENKNREIGEKQEQKLEIVNFYKRKIELIETHRHKQTPESKKNIENSREESSQTLNERKQQRPKLIQRHPDKSRTRRKTIEKHLHRQDLEQQEGILKGKKMIRSRASWNNQTDEQVYLEQHFDEELQLLIQNQKLQILQLRTAVDKHVRDNAQLQQKLQKVKDQRDQEANLIYQYYDEILQIFNVQWNPSEQPVPHQDLISAINVFTKKIDGLMKSVETLELQVFKLSKENIEIKDQQTDILKKCEKMISNAESENDELVYKCEKMRRKLEHSQIFAGSLDKALKETNNKVMQLGLLLINQKLAQRDQQDEEGIRQEEEQLEQEKVEELSPERHSIKAQKEQQMLESPQPTKESKPKPNKANLIVHKPHSPASQPLDILPRRKTRK